MRQRGVFNCLTCSEMWCWSTTCGALAPALQSRFQEHVSPASGVSMSVRREFQSTGASKGLLRLRARVTTISSRIVERALQLRGSPDLKLTADREALENTVGATCRADAWVAVKRATSTFADAEHDVSLIVPRLYDACTRMSAITEQSRPHYTNASGEFASS